MHADEIFIRIVVELIVYSEGPVGFVSGNETFRAANRALPQFLFPALANGDRGLLTCYFYFDGQNFKDWRLWKDIFDLRIIIKNLISVLEKPNLFLTLLTIRYTYASFYNYYYYCYYFHSIRCI